jgi:hypothetical protein
MAIIQPIEARVGLDTGGIPDTSRDQSIARGLGQLGDAIGQVGQVMGEHELRLAEQKRKLEEFRFEQEFLRRGNAIGAEYENMKLNTDPSGEGFAAAANTMVMGQWDEFLKTVPDWLRPRFDELVLTDKDTRLSQAASDEVAQQRRFYETGIADAVSTAQTDVGSNPGAFHQRIAQVIRAIDATNWSPAKKADEKRKAEEMLGRAWIARQLSDDPMRRTSSPASSLANTV